MDAELYGCSLLQVLMLVGHWTAVAERGVPPLAVTKPFDVVEHGAARGRVAVKNAGSPSSFVSV